MMPSIGLYYWVALCVIATITLFGYNKYDERARRLTAPILSNRPSIAGMMGTDPSISQIVTKKVVKRVQHRDPKESTNHTNSRKTQTPSEPNNHTNESKAIAAVPHANQTVKSITQTDVAKNDGKLFYMYELEEEFWWRWPVDGSDCSGNGYVGHEHKENSGIGPLVDADSGLYLTWHFSLFSSLYNRMKRSSRRTYDPEKASLFIIPYDLGLDGYLDARSCNNRRSCSNGLVGKLTAILTASKHFQRHEGADHALLWSLGQYHPWPRAGCDVLMKDTCAKCTITCYWMDSSRAESRFISIPFPSGYHWWDGIKQLPWDLALAPQRNLTAVYLGSTQTLNPTHTKIRRAMTAQCNTSSECHWLQISHSSKDTNIVDLLSTYKRSVFCLCPPGDDPARKAVFDCIVSGSIPVIFELNTLYNQYPWHFSEQEALDMSVYVPGGMIRSGKVDFMSVLLAISPEVIRKKQEVLATIAPRVQYAMPPPERLVDRYENTTWDPPFKDGVELTLDGMFARADAMVHNRSTHLPPKVLSGREWGREYDMVRVQVPNITDHRAAAQAEQDRLIRQGMKAATKPHGGGRPGHGQHGTGQHGSGPHGGGHVRKHKPGGAAGTGGGAGDGAHLGGEKEGGGRGGKGSGHAGKGSRSVPSMAAPGEEENGNLAE